MSGPSGTPSTRGDGREWIFKARGSVTATLTDNVGLAPAALARSDAVFGISLPLVLRRQGPRVNAFADYTPTVYLYADNREANNLQNNLRSLLTAEAVDDFFFVEASATVLPRYISPFLPRPDTGVGTTANRTQQISLSLSPYIRHQTGTGWKYLIRNDNLWTSYTESALPNSATNRLLVTAESPPARIYYALDYSYVYSRDDSLPTGLYQQVGRMRPIWRATRVLSLSARLGYESNDYVTSYSGGVYGVGADWNPSPRTRVEGFLEDRFFGAAYGLTFSHRSRRTTWKLNASRNAFTTALQPFTLRPGTTAEIVDDAYRSRIADPAQREQAVQQFLQQAGLPPTLTQPYTFYTNQIYLAEQFGGSVAFLGRRNSAELTLFWQQNEPITTSGDLLFGAFFSTNRLRQQGATLTLSHRLTPRSNVTLVANRLYAESSNTRTPSATGFETIQDTVRLSVTRQLSRDTNATVGLRWVNFDSDSSPYRERAVLVAVAHTF